MNFYRNMNFSRMIKVLLLGVMAALMSSCAHGDGGPGMSLTYASLKKGVRIHIESAKMPDGRGFSNAGSFGPNKRWMIGGATLSAAPDTRQLPEWVEFEWQEWPYPSQAPPNETQDEGNSRVHALARSLPRKTQRVSIRDRVPQDVVDEVIQSRRDASPGKLPEKVLDIYLVWTDQGIKFRWQLKHWPKLGGHTLLRSGGDEIENP